MLARVHNNVFLKTLVLMERTLATDCYHLQNLLA